MNKKVLFFAVALLVVAVLATPLVGTAEAYGCRRRQKTCESFEVNLTTDLAAATMETEVKPNKIIISWEEVMTAYTITVDGKDYNLFDDFIYTGFAVYTVWKPTGETHPVLGIPLGEFMETKFDYMYDFAAVPGGIDGTIKMRAVWRSDDFNDFFTAGTMKIKSLRGTGDLRNVKIKATNGGIGAPNHVGTVCGWPSIESFVFHIENAEATDIIEPKVFPPGAEIGSPDARYVFYYREFNLNPAFNNYVEIGTTQTPIAPEDYECKYTVFWTYDDPVLGTGSGEYKVFEKITLPNGYITMISKETATFEFVDGIPVFIAEGTFIGYGKIDGQKVMLKGERHASFGAVGFVIENTGTIRFW